MKFYVTQGRFYETIINVEEELLFCLHRDETEKNPLSREKIAKIAKTVLPSTFTVEVNKNAFTQYFNLHKHLKIPNILYNLSKIL